MRERREKREKRRGKDRFQRTRVGGGTSGARSRSASRSEVNLSGNALGQHVWHSQDPRLLRLPLGLARPTINMLKNLREI